MPGQPDRDYNKTVAAVNLADVTQAIRRIRQPMQKHHGTQRGAFWLDRE